MITIQCAGTKDAATIADIGRISFLQSHGHSAPAADIDGYVARKYTPEAMEAELADPANIYHLIRYDGQLAGYSKIVLNCPNEKISTQNVTCLDRLYLLHDFYDLKLGASLLEHNVNLSRQAGQSAMWLYTWTENSRAVSFYHKAGFVIIGAANFPISSTHSNPNHIMYMDYGVNKKTFD